VIAALPSSPHLLNVPEITTGKISTPTIQLVMSYSGVTGPNLTKFIQDVQKWLPITLLKSKLWSSNPFSYANVTNEDRRQIAGKSRQKLHVLTAKNSEIVGRKFTKFGHDVAWLLPLNLVKADLRSANPLLNVEGKSKGRFTRRRLYNFLCLKLQGHWTEFTKFLQGVQKWLPITLLKSKLWSSNPFSYANVTNEDRRQIAGKSRQKLRVLTAKNSEIVRRKFTKFGYDVAWLLLLNLLKANLRSANPLSNAEAKSNVR